MKTISKEFEGIYGNGQPLGIRTNKTINNMLKSIPTKQYVDNASENISRNVYKEPAEFPWGAIFLFIVLMIIWILYYYRDYLYDLLIGNKEKEKEEDKKKQEAKEKAEREEIEKNNIKIEEEKEKKKQEEINKGGIQQLDNKINSAGYKQEQLVKENSYCYIGTENGQRECTNAYAGDVCMSGQIFPKMEICINPNLRL